MNLALFTMLAFVVLYEATSVPSILTLITPLFNEGVEIEYSCSYVIAVDSIGV